MNEMLRKAEAIGMGHGMSAMEVLLIVQQIAAMETDPIEPTGPRFVFPAEHDPMVYCRDPLWINPEVPDPYARVDLFSARSEFGRDAVRCRTILEDPNVTVDDILRVRWNTLGWARFWAVRDRDPEWRARWRVAVERLEQEIRRTAVKAQARSGPRVVKTEE
jgi:hypothetical protein